MIGGNVSVYLTVRCLEVNMRIKITISEMAHLIKAAPLNHYINFGYCSDFIVAEEDSWEHKELLRLRNEQAHAADAGKPCENGEHRFFQGFCTKCNKYIGTAD